jgi:hypothetical protein
MDNGKTAPPQAGQFALRFSGRCASKNQGLIEIDDAEARQRLLSEMTSHIGEANAISMSALYTVAFDRPWNDKINNTRPLRKLITTLREEGVPICSVSTHTGGGYYLAAAGSELVQYLRRSERRALLILKRNAKIKKISLPNYLGQIKLGMEDAPNEAAQ